MTLNNLRRTGAGLLVLVLAGCSAQVITNEGHAMAPALKDGDRAVVSRDFETVERGDIVAFKYPKDESKNFVKRVIALPGERVESVNGRILVDGVAIDEPYVAEENRSGDTWAPIVVAPRHYFVLGDNRSNSSDSRHWGQVGRDAVWGKIF